MQTKTHESTAIPPPGFPSLVGQGKPSCHSPEKIKKSSFKFLFEVGRHWINLTSGCLDLRQYLYPFRWCKLYTQFTSWWVKFRFIILFRASILPNTLNIFGTHWVGDSLKNLRQFLVMRPIGMVIPPSMKAIMGVGPNNSWTRPICPQRVRRPNPRRAVAQAL